MENPKPEVVEEISLSTAVAKVAAKGVPVSSLISGLMAMAMILTLYILVTHTSDAKESVGVIAKAMSEHTKAIQDQTRAQNLTTCILAMDQSRRRQEFSEENSFCRRMVFQR